MFLLVYRNILSHCGKLIRGIAWQSLAENGFRHRFPWVCLANNLLSA